jgi:hypothetical protein
MKNCERCGALTDDDLEWCFDCELTADIALYYTDDETDPYEDPEDPLYWDTH